MQALERDDVDVVCLNEATPFLQSRVFRDGTVVFDRDPVARVSFTARAMSIYLDLVPFLRKAYAG